MINKMLMNLIAEYPLYLNRQIDGSVSKIGVKLFWQKFEYISSHRKYLEAIL